MKYLTIGYIKQHSRIDYDCEDAILELYGESAERTVLNYLNRTYYDLIEEYGGVPEDIRHATLMLVDASYQHRSPASPTQMYYVLYGFDAKLKPYMRLSSPVGEDEMQTVVLGSDVKIEFTADLPDDLTLADVDFSAKVINADEKDKSETYTKADCLIVDDGKYYVALVNTENLGIGTLLMKLTVHIPDTDYPVGYRKEVININPNVRVKG